MKPVRPAILLLLAVCCSPTGAFAQLPSSVSDSARISLLTVLPGTPIYTVFGHSAIRVSDPQQGLDASFNYGTFEFDGSFLPKFVRGKLDYYLSVSTTESALRQYKRENRTIIEQHMDLASNDVKLLYRRLWTNALPQNKYYRYDFFFDNCSTRVLDMVEGTLGDRLAVSPADMEPLSFRELIDPYLTGVPFIDTGVDLVLGADTDRIATYRERSFLPEYLMERFYNLNVDGRPLVASTDTVFTAAPRSSVLTTGRMAIAAWIAFLALAFVSVRAWRRGLPPRDRLDVVLFLVTGLIGVAILLMWFGTEHVVTDKNWNLAWAWPTHAVAAVLLVKRRAPQLAKGYLACAAVVAAVLCAGWFVWPQALPQVMMPVVALIAIRAARQFDSRRQTNGLRNLP